MTHSAETISLKGCQPFPRGLWAIASIAALGVYLVFLAHLPSPAAPRGVRPSLPPPAVGANPPIDLMQVSVSIVLGAGPDDPSAAPYTDLIRFWRSEIDIAEVGRIVFSREMPFAVDRPLPGSENAAVLPDGQNAAALSFP